MLQHRLVALRPLFVLCQPSSLDALSSFIAMKRALFLLLGTLRLTSGLGEFLGFLLRFGYASTHWIPTGKDFPFTHQVYPNGRIGRHFC